VPNILIFALSLAATIVVSAVLLWWGTKAITGFKMRIETVFWVSLVAQIYRCVASLGTQLVLPNFPVMGFILVLCSMVYVQALILRLAMGVGYQELSLRKAHLVSLFTVLIGFVGVMPLIAWSVKRISG
jgi:hypothetical protein